MVYFSLLQAEQSDLCADRHGRGAGEVEAVQIFPLAGRGILVAGKAARVGAVEADGADVVACFRLIKEHRAAAEIAECGGG